jgi:hypothetical protein
MVRIQGEIVIGRRVEDVFDFVGDERNRHDPRVRRPRSSPRDRSDALEMATPVERFA